MISRRGFVRVAGTTAAIAAGLALVGCDSRGDGRQTDAADATPAATEAEQGASVTSDEASSSSDAQPASGAGQVSGAGSIVVYFSRTGENYGVGDITEGNTAIVAQMIAEATSSDLFEIVPVTPYPEGYDDCCDVALEERDAGARPAIEGDVDLSAYSTVYVGYPIWWGDLPMCVYTFIESHDWAGKVVRPFCTHAGSGLAGTEARIGSACPGAEVGEGLAIAGTTAQNARDEARAAVDAWLA